MTTENGSEARPELIPASLEELRSRRDLMAAGPSGNAYRIRPLNAEHHAMAGNFPQKLRELAMQGSKGMREMFKDDKALTEHGKQFKSYLDDLVVMQILEPDFRPVLEAQRRAEAEGAEAPATLDDYLLPEDYHWLVAIAFRETDRDGEGKLLWGREPLSRFQLFRDEHDCATDCASCGRAARALSAALA